MEQDAHVLNAPRINELNDRNYLCYFNERDEDLKLDLWIEYWKLLSMG